MTLFQKVGCSLWVLASIARAENFSLQPTDETTEAEFIEISDVGAGVFDPAVWQAGTLNLLADIRSPLIEPLPGRFRNIYAPSIVESRDGWRVFYGGWDGVPTGNDRIYSLTTKDFLTFSDRHTVIEHGAFQHVCNVSAAPLPPRGFALICTGYPDALGLNKPVFFSTPDGKLWNGSTPPCPATTNDIIRIHGYEKYVDADINGMNVLLRENGTFRLYFCNFKDFGRVYRASGTNGKDFHFDGVALPNGTAINDVKKFRVGSTNWYLMGLHMNGEQTWFSLSSDGMNFSPMQSLFTNATPTDRYIVALGWVTSGEQEKNGRRLLGVLYGAGAVPTLNQNRVFARWLQPRCALKTAAGKIFFGSLARGPARQLIPVPEKHFVADFQWFDESGTKFAGEIKGFSFEAGRVYRLKR
jgi:hypothetical protein